MPPPDAPPTVFRGYVGFRHPASGEVEFTPPVTLRGPAEAWGYARLHGGHADEVRIVDDADALVLHVERDALPSHGRGGGVARLVWPTEAEGVPAGFIAAFNAAIGGPARSA